jgi:hypothetical protein
VNRISGIGQGKVGLMYVLFGKQKYFACRLKIPAFAVHHDCGRKYFALRLKNDNVDGLMIIFRLPVDTVHLLRLLRKVPAGFRGYGDSRWVMPMKNKGRVYSPPFTIILIVLTREINRR